MTCPVKTTPPAFKRSTAVFLVILMAAFLQACAATQTCSLDGSDCRPRPKIALILPSADAESSIAMADKAKALAENDPSVDMRVMWPLNGNGTSGQIALLEQSISEGYDIIVISPAHSTALVPTLKKARDAGIVVVPFQNALDRSTMHLYGLPDDFLFVGPDNYLTARRMGGMLGRALPENAQVAILEGPPLAADSAPRAKGFIQSAQDHNLELVAMENAGWKPAKARELTSGLIKKHPELKGIMACSDDMAKGALQAIEDAGLAGEIQVVGFGNTPTGQELLQEGKMLATADSHGVKTMQRAINTGLRILQGESLDGWIRTPSDVITAPMHANN